MRGGIWQLTRTGKSSQHDIGRAGDGTKTRFHTTEQTQRCACGLRRQDTGLPTTLQTKWEQRDKQQRRTTASHTQVNGPVTPTTAACQRDSQRDTNDTRISIMRGT